VLQVVQVYLVPQDQLQEREVGCQMLKSLINLLIENESIKSKISKAFALEIKF